jgi:cell division protein FtsL
MTEEHNLPEVFPFDESKLPELRERLKRKMWKVLLPVIVGVIALHLLVNHLQDIAQLSFMTIMMMILFIVVVKRALKKIVNEYRNYRIITNDKSITSFYRIKKEIEWKYTKLKVKDSGEMIIINLKLSRLRRFFDERGAIVIPPEVEDYEKLKLLVFKKAKAV